MFLSLQAAALNLTAFVVKSTEILNLNATLGKVFVQISPFVLRTAQTFIVPQNQQQTGQHGTQSKQQSQSMIRLQRNLAVITRRIILQIFIQQLLQFNQPVHPQQHHWPPLHPPKKAL